jgi:hypothetical protein
VGEKDSRTWKEYETYGDHVIAVFGATRLVEELTPADFVKLRAHLQKTHKSLVSIKGDIRKVKVFLKFAYDDGYVDRPVRTGDGFKTPKAQAPVPPREVAPRFSRPRTIPTIACFWPCARRAGGGWTRSSGSTCPASVRGRSTSES